MKLGMAFNRLIGILDDGLQLYTELCELETRKRPEIIKGRLVELRELSAKEAELLKRIEEMDKQRVRALVDLQSERGLPANPQMALTELIEALPSDEERQSLRVAQQVLAETTRSLRTANERNQLLLEQSISFIEDTVASMTESPEGDYVYQKPNSPISTHRRASGFDIRT